MKPKLVKPKDMVEYVPYADRRQGRNRRVLTLDEMLEISQKVLLDFEKHKDVAK